MVRVLLSIHLLKKDIEDCREEMVRLALITSLSDQRVIETSKRLDKLINTYYKLSTKSS